MAFAFLFDAQYEGSEETTLAKEAGIVNLAFKEWFKPFRPEIVARDASRADGGADEEEDRMSGLGVVHRLPLEPANRTVSFYHFTPPHSRRNCQAFLPVKPPVPPGLARDSRAHCP